jgi:hypothetical protein
MKSAASMNNQRTKGNRSTNHMDLIFQPTFMNLCTRKTSQTGMITASFYTLSKRNETIAITFDNKIELKSKIDDQVTDYSKIREVTFTLYE